MKKVNKVPDGQDHNDCTLPEGVAGKVVHTPDPECRQVVKDCEFVLIPTMACEEPCASPRFKASLKEVEPCWHVCPSTPPALDCPPITSGWGQHDGGVHWWATTTGYDPEACPDTSRREYLQVQYESTLDQETSDAFHGELPFYRNNQLAKMSAQVFINMARRVALIGINMGWLAAAEQIAEPAKFSLGLVATGVDEVGKATYGLGISYDDAPIGTPIALETTRDANGLATALTLPVQLVLDSEA